MPKQSIDIKTFQGMVGSVDAHDAPAGSAIFAENVDNIQSQGLFTPLPEDRVLSGGSQFADCDLVTVYSDGSRGVAYDQQEGELRSMTLATGSSEGSQAATRSGWDTAVSDGEAAHVGLGPSESSPPKWVGEIGHQQFGQGTVDTLVFENAEIEWAECVGLHVTSSNTKFFLPDVTVANNIAKWDSSQEVFENGSSYYYYASLVYDGFQEGPLFMIGLLAPTDTNIQLYGTGDAYTTDTHILSNTSAGAPMHEYDGDLGDTPVASTYSWQDATQADETNESPATGLSRVDMTLRVRTSALSGKPTLPRRVTRINIYRATDVTGTIRPPYKWQSEQFGVSDPLLIQSIDINDSDWDTEVVPAGSTDFDNSTDEYAEIELQDSGIGLESFQDRTALPLGLNNMQLHYGVSCVADSFHVVGRCWHPELKQIDSWLFKSKPYRYDTFDWTLDYLVLPSPPNALAYWGGKIFAFCSGRTYVINPVSFDIEETLEGMGAEHRKSVCVCDRGMFWADKNNIYWHDGNAIKPIGGAVLLNQYNDDAAWLSRTTSGSGSTPVSVYSPQYDSVVFGYLNASGSFAALMFNVAGQRWSYLTTGLLSGTQTLSCSFTNEDGEAVLGFRDSDVLYDGEFFRLFGEGDQATPVYRAWEFVSQQIKDGGSKTRYYDVRVHHTGSPPTVTFFDNDPDYTTEHALYQWAEEVTGATHKGGVQISPGYEYQYMRDFAIRVAGTASQSCTEISIIYRPLSSR